MSEKCIHCGGELPPLNGVEQNDFATQCVACDDWDEFILERQIEAMDLAAYDAAEKEK